VNFQFKRPNVTEYGGALSVSVAQSSGSILTSFDRQCQTEAASWFAVRTRPRFEKKVAAELREKGVTAFLPLYSATHQWTDRRKVVETVLFPGYLFVQQVPVADSRISVLRTKGVLGFVGVRGAGTAIPDAEVEAIQMLIDKRIPFAPFSYLRVGQRVRIRGGALDGMKGFLTAINHDESLVISIDLIQRSVAIRVKGYEIEQA
jgi:transcription antitermination factor NusG